jgi:hypothetical protein
MHGNQHLGVAEEEAIERLIDLLSTGMWHVPAVPARKRIRRRAAADSATRADPSIKGHLPPPSHPR